VNLFVSDVDASFAFYNGLCGFEEVFAEPAIWARFLGNGNTHHDVALMGAVARDRIGRGGHVQVAAARGTRAGLNHLGFEMAVERDLFDAMVRAEQAGVAFHRVVDHQISHSVYVFDPDGNYIEVYADVVVDWRGLFRESAGQLITGTWDPERDTVSTVPKFDPDPEIHVVAEAAVHPRRVSSATLVVADLAPSRAFYERILGLSVIDEVAGGVVLGGALGGRDLVLVERSGDEPLGLHHFTVELLDATAFDETVARLRAQGRAPRVVRSGATLSAVLEDPDGVSVAITGSAGARGEVFDVDPRWAA
jgi:catechol 2,3-dioxygenase